MNWQETVEHWKQFEALDPLLREELKQMTPDELEEAFGSTIRFGTAGMREVMAPGTNRMNRYTVRRATSGLVKLIQAAGEEAIARGVAIAYDSRHLSADFAEEAARVLASAGIQVYLYESLRPTPVLSFAVRYLKTFAGIMITASHNPAAYNGYKVYGQDGGQMPPEEADRLITYVKEAQDPLTLELKETSDLLEEGTLALIGKQVDQAYLKEIQEVNINPTLISEMGEYVRLVFTPLHGAGGYLGLQALEQAGFTDVLTVGEQFEPDGDFPSVISPNPEDSEAFAVSLQLAERSKADLVVATDPDADRLGAMIRTSKGTYRLLTGNQIACLMIAYLLEAHKEQGTLPSNGVVVKSIVSTHLADRQLEAEGLQCIDVLTGFKFIAEKIQQFEETGEYTFLLGFEESFGYLIRPFVRDKDAIQALVLLAELTAYHKKEGRTLGDALDLIYERHGYFEERTLSFAFPGLEGRERMEQLMQRLREEPITEIAGSPLVEKADYLLGTITYEDGSQKQVDLPPSNALKYTLEDKTWLAFRPSGTEPKIKLYLGVEAKERERALARADEVEAVIRSWVKD